MEGVSKDVKPSQLSIEEANLQPAALEHQLQCSLAPAVCLLAFPGRNISAGTCDQGWQRHTAYELATTRESMSSCFDSEHSTSLRSDFVFAERVHYWSYCQLTVSAALLWHVVLTSAI